MTSILNTLRHYKPAQVMHRWKIRAQRQALDHLLGSIPKELALPGVQRVLIEGLWENPNYWVRLAMFRAALGLTGKDEVAVIGPPYEEDRSRSYRRLGISHIIKFFDHAGSYTAFRQQAKIYLKETKTAQDILNWKLPADFPASYFYDGVLKRQQSAIVNLLDPKLETYVAELLYCLDRAQKIYDSHPCDLVLVTHVLNFKYGAMAWIALQRKISVVLLFGNYGVPRFVKLFRTEDIFDAIDRPRAEDLNVLSPQQADELQKLGESCLQSRRQGKTNDLGAEYAFRRASFEINREAICRFFSWDPKKPIICMYASNWFDYPHSFGMSHFRDFLDWLQTTMAVISENKDVNWLLKSHPCDQWYGGITLKHLVPADQPMHIKLVPTEWNGAALMNAVDGAITYHGTAGIEYGALGKPVLVADRGWYHDCGFVVTSASREEYLQHVRQGTWLHALSPEQQKRRSQLFAGLYFGHPSWQNTFVLEDDSRQDRLYDHLLLLLRNPTVEFRKEIQLLREWYRSPHPYYHTYKMLRSTELPSVNRNSLCATDGMIMTNKEG